MSYEIPEPMKNPIASLVVFYKVLKEVEYDDKCWDRVHFGRCSKAAKELLGICGGFDIAKRCLEELSTKFTEIGCDWKLETVVSHAHDWKVRRKGNDKSVRQRFSDALAKQRAADEDKSQRTSFTAGEMLNTLGNLTIIGRSNGSQGGGTDNSDGEVGRGVQPSGLEEKAS